MKDYIFDIESLATTPDCKILSLSAIAFDPNPETELDFDYLVSNGIEIKFDIKKQPNRTVDMGTVEWWKNQNEEAKKVLIPSEKDVSLMEGILAFRKYLKDNGVDRNKSLAYCRGMSFDFPILKNILMDLFPEEDVYSIEPVNYYRQRDVRSKIEGMVLNRNYIKVPLPENTLKNFIPHNSLHDCAKDILMLKYAECYAKGLKEVGEL